MSNLETTWRWLADLLGEDRAAARLREIVADIAKRDTVRGAELLREAREANLVQRLGPAVAGDLIARLCGKSLESAEKLAAELAQRFPDDADSTLAHAHVALSQGRFEQAAELARDVLTRVSTASADTGADRQRATARKLLAEAHLAEQDPGAALEQLAALADTGERADALLRKVDRRLSGAGAAPPGFTDGRVALIGNVTLNYLAEAVRWGALAERVYATCWTGGFDLYRQELLDPESALYSHEPHAVLVVLDWRELLPDLYRANLVTDTDALWKQIDAETATLRQLLAQFRERCRGAVLVTGPVRPHTTPLGFLDAGHPRSVARHFAHLEQQLAETVREIDGVYLHQTHQAFASIGTTAAQSPKMRYLARMPFTPEGMALLARDFGAFVRQSRGKARKCLALDLDNTLWGGIIGEDGLEGIQLGPDGIGRAFVEFQQEILRLHQQGVILAVCSKNNEADALEVFEKHPDMVLKPDHFAALRINWAPKPHNLQELAADINIGIDSFVFLDDNPVERDAVRQMAPQVLTPELPRDPAEYPAFLRSLTCFQSLQLTEDDAKRGRFYATERQRRALQQTAGSLDDYLRALNMVAHIMPMDDFSRPRIAQLIQRTNQFNLTTRRHSEVDIQAMAASEDHELYSLQLEDRYGDNGIVGVAILKLTDAEGRKVARIDTLLMSCRILGRNVEKAFLGYLVDRAAARGATEIIGEYIPTKKNAQVAEYYPRYGFEELASEGEVQRWRFDCTTQRIECPDYITIKDAHQAEAATQ